MENLLLHRWLLIVLLLLLLLSLNRRRPDRVLMDLLDLLQLSRRRGVLHLLLLLTGHHHLNLLRLNNLLRHAHLIQLDVLLLLMNHLLRLLLGLWHLLTHLKIKKKKKLDSNFFFKKNQKILT